MLWEKLRHLYIVLFDFFLFISFFQNYYHYCIKICVVKMKTERFQLVIPWKVKYSYMDDIWVFCSMVLLIMDEINMKSPRVKPCTSHSHITCMNNSLHTKRVRNEGNNILSDMWLTVELNEKCQTEQHWHMGTTIEHNKRKN